LQYAIEWLGTGRSLRPEFPSYDVRSLNDLLLVKTCVGMLNRLLLWQCDEVDEKMVDAVEEWRKELKVRSLCSLRTKGTR
jgi:hypothetical protein